MPKNPSPLDEMAAGQDSTIETEPLTVTDATTERAAAVSLVCGGIGVGASRDEMRDALAMLGIGGAA